MVGGVATIAERNQVRCFIASTAGPRDQVVNVGFARETHDTAGLANAAVSGKDDFSDLAPSLVLLSHRIVERWLLQPELPGRVEPAITWIGRACLYPRSRSS
jgi:hypothetical protein